MKPWSAKLPPLSGRALTGIGAGALVGSFYIGTGDIAIATKMGALFGMDMWWTFFVLGLAGWTLMDMSTRYYLRFGRTPLSIFKEVHPVFSIYLFVNAMTTVSAVVFLWGPPTHLAAVAVLHMDDQGDIAPAAAMAMMIVYTSTAVRVAHALLTRGIEKRTQAWRRREFVAETIKQPAFA